MRVSRDQRRLLLRVAREAVVERVVGSEAERATSPTMARASGAFVTLRLDGALRGCVGQVEVTTSLVETVREVAMAAATEDPRFDPVRDDELASVVVEVSVLGPLESCAGPDDVEAGRHGLVVEDGARRGLLLPQVALEFGWDRDVFIANTCAKAGLRPDAWRRGATLFRFEAEVFSEDDAGFRGFRDP